MDVLVTILILFATGFAASFIGVLIGVGGGFLAVPILLFLGFTPERAAGTSLLMILVSSSLGAFSYSRQKRIHYGFAVKLGLSAIPGAILGANVVRMLTPPVFASAFAIIMLIASGYILVKPRKSEPANIPRKVRGNSWVVYPLGFAIGVLSATFGIGGGVIQVPAMIFFLGLPTHIATATSNLIMVFNSFSGVATHIYLGNTVFFAAASLASGTLIAAPLSARVSRKVRSEILQRILAAVMLFIGVRVMLMALSNL